MDRFAQAGSWPDGWRSAPGSENTGDLLDRNNVSLCRNARPLVVVTRAGDDNADDVAQTYFTPSGWDGMR
jgi:hypothetical protein